MPPDPFLAAVREAREETGIVLNRRHVFFYALGMQADQRHPLLLGAAKLEGKLENVLKTCRDAWENEVFYYLDLDDLDTCAAVLVYGDWIPASAVAVALSLLDRHGYKSVEDALNQADQRKFRSWLSRTPWHRRKRWSLLA